jgi:hypothetical protein
VKGGINKMKAYLRNSKTGQPADFRNYSNAHKVGARIVRSGAKARYKVVSAGGGHARLVLYDKTRKS